MNSQTSKPPTQTAMQAAKLRDRANEFSLLCNDV